MTHFLDKLPLDFSDRGLQELVGTLVENYPSARAATPIIQKAGVSLGEVNLDQPMVYAWPEVLSTARSKGRLRALLEVVTTSTDDAVADRVKELLADAPVVAAPPPGDGIDWKVDPAAADGELERIVESQSTLLDTSFLEQGLVLGAAVCRLLVTLSDGDYHGTAFRIGDDLLLTNHHVLFDDAGPATKVVAWFGYERSFGGAERAYTEVSGDPASIVGDATHDWAVIRTSGPMPANAPVIPLTGAAVPRELDRVYVIQHPNGGVKKIGMVHNIVTSVDDDVVQYRVDTEGGSSGSPVFDEQWRVVALHHRWGSRRSAGKIEYYNQGRRIERVLEGLTAAGLV